MGLECSDLPEAAFNGPALGRVGFGEIVRVVILRANSGDHLGQSLVPEKQVADERQDHQQRVGRTGQAEPRQPLDERSHQVLRQVRGSQKQVRLQAR